VVLGALLVVVILLFVSCSGGGDNKNSNRGQATSSQSTVPAPTSSTPDDEPSFSDAEPGGGGPSLPAPGDLTAQPTLGDGTGTSGAPSGQNPGGTNANVTAPAGTTCADSEMSVTPVPASTTIKRGTPVVIRLKIKNISTRTCSRDVGADPQEIYIDQGARKYWSSDTCSTARNSDVRAFAPGAEREYSVTWNGRQSSKCQGGVAAGPAPIPGQYEVRGRLGTKVSDAVVLTIVA
jgi:hypothetical protein